MSPSAPGAGCTILGTWGLGGGRGLAGGWSYGDWGENGKQAPNGYTAPGFPHPLIKILQPLSLGLASLRFFRVNKGASPLATSLGTRNLPSSWEGETGLESLPRVRERLWVEQRLRTPRDCRTFILFGPNCVLEISETIARI